MIYLSDTIQKHWIKAVHNVLCSYVIQMTFSLQHAWLLTSSKSDFESLLPMNGDPMASLHVKIRILLIHSASAHTLLFRHTNRWTCLHSFTHAHNSLNLAESHCPPTDTCYLDYQNVFTALLKGDSETSLDQDHFRPRLSSAHSRICVGETARETDRQTWNTIPHKLWSVWKEISDWFIKCIRSSLRRTKCLEINCSVSTQPNRCLTVHSYNVHAQTLSSVKNIGKVKSCIHQLMISS